MHLKNVVSHFCCFFLFLCIFRRCARVIEVNAESAKWLNNSEWEAYRHYRNAICSSITKTGQPYSARSVGLLSDDSSFHIKLIQSLQAHGRHLLSCSCYVLCECASPACMSGHD